MLLEPARQSTRADPGLGQQPSYVTALRWKNQGQHLTGSAGAGGATGAVQVLLGTAWRIGLEDQVDTVDVDAAGGDVGGHQHRKAAVLESGQDARTSALSQPAVKRPGQHARGPQLIGHPVGAALGSDEHDGALGAADEIGGHEHLFGRRDLDQAVVHGRNTGLVRIDAMGDRVDEMVPHQPVHGPVQGGGEEQPLTAGRYGFQDLGDRRQEAEISHVVGLVQDGDLHPTEIGDSLVHQVDQPTRSGHHDVRTRGEGTDLRSVGHSAGHQGDPETLRAGQRSEHIGDLEGQLAGGDEHDSPRLLGATRAGGQPHDHRQPEGQGLAGTRTGASEDVATGQRVRNGLGLDRERRRDAAGAEVVHERSGKAQSSEAAVERDGWELRRRCGSDRFGPGHLVGRRAFR